MTNTQRSSDRIRRRRVAISAAVGLSAVASVPVFAELAKSPAPAVPQSGSITAAAAIASLMQVDAAAGSSVAALAQGKEQLAAKQYEEALASLEQAKADELDATQRGELESSLQAARTATAERRSARAAFEQGEKQLAAGDKWGAIASYAAAKDNAYADAATAEKATTQIALAGNELGELKPVYESAKSDLDAGNLDQARAKFVALNAIGYRAGALSKSPADYVAEINAKQAAPTAVADAGTAAEARVVADGDVASPRDKKKAARDAYVAGRDAYHRGDTAGAKANFEKAASLGYQKGFGEAGPQKMLAEIAKKEQADIERTARANRSVDQTAVASAAAVSIPSNGPDAASPAPTNADAGAAPVTQTNVEAPVAAPADMGGTTVAQATTPAEPMAPTAATGDIATPATPAAPAATDSSLAAAADADRIRAEQNAFQARRYTEQAQQSQQAQRFNEALGLYDSALKLDPNNSQAQQGRAEVLKVTGRSEAQTDIATRYTGVIEQKKSTINFSVQAALEEARMARAQNDFPAARRALIRAQAARDSDPGIFTQEEIRGFDSAIRTETAATDRADREALAAQQAKDRETAITEQDRVTRKAEQERQNTITALVKQSRQLTQQGRNKDALKVVDQILTIDPRNDYALGVRPLIYDRIQLGNQRKATEDLNRNTIDLLNMAEEQRIPIPDLLTYPTDWPDLSARRDETTSRERGGATDQATEAILAKQLPELRFDGVPFTDVIDFLRDTTQANIFVNWTAIEGAGIDKNAPITTRLTNVKFSKVLEIVLDSAGGGVTRLAYTIDDGVITISTQDDLAKNVATRTYDIRDLLVRIPDFEAPSVQLDSGGEGGGGQLFTGSNDTNQSDNEQDREELVEQITQLITDTIASDSWKVNGGLIGAVQELGGQLIVTQTPENQTQIARLLEQLRETRAIQVNVEARFLTVQRNFLEEVGVDFDFQFNASYDGATDTTPAFGPGTQFSPVTVQQNSVGSGTGGFTGPANLAGTGVSTNLGTEAATSNYGLSTGVNAFLDDFRASLFLRAVQLGQNATTLTAPKLTLFNGQSAYVAVTTDQYYVSELTPVVGTGAVGYQADTQRIPSGVVMSVQATVSADRKYVTLTIIPTLRRLVALRTFSFASGQTVTPIGNGGGIVQNINQQVQLPEVETTQVATTVSVPDRGTLLLGGQTLMGEIEREAGTPVLSKIPFLKRLFTNRGTAKDEQVLLILVKPTIIIQREVEASSFPLLESR